MVTEPFLRWSFIYYLLKRLYEYDFNRMIGLFMIELALDKMDVAEKVSLMEILWEDLSHVPSQIESPKWHGELLKERLSNLKNGTDSFKDWNSVKKGLLGLIE